MASRGLLVAATAIWVAACSPFGGGAYSCARDDQCSGGTCSAGFCSVTDSGCISGLRYGDSAGGLSNTCVGAGPIDANNGIDSKEFHDGPPPGVTCFGTGFGKTCFATVPTAPMTLDAQQINTDSSPLCATNVETNPPWCVIAASDLTISAGTISAIGN